MQKDEFQTEFCGMKFQNVLFLFKVFSKLYSQQNFRNRKKKSRDSQEILLVPPYWFGLQAGSLSQAKTYVFIEQVYSSVFDRTMRIG